MFKYDFMPLNPCVLILSLIAGNSCSHFIPPLKMPASVKLAVRFISGPFQQSCQCFLFLPDMKEKCGPWVLNCAVRGPCATLSGHFNYWDPQSSSNPSPHDPVWNEPQPQWAGLSSILSSIPVTDAVSISSITAATTEELGSLQPCHGGTIHHLACHGGFPFCCKYQSETVSVKCPPPFFSLLIFN